MPALPALPAVPTLHTVHTVPAATLASVQAAGLGPHTGHIILLFVPVIGVCVLTGWDRWAARRRRGRQRVCEHALTAADAPLPHAEHR